MCHWKSVAVEEILAFGFIQFIIVLVNSSWIVHILFLSVCEFKRIKKRVLWLLLCGDEVTRLDEKWKSSGKKCKISAVWHASVNPIRLWVVSKVPSTYKNTKASFFHFAHSPTAIKHSFVSNSSHVIEHSIWNHHRSVFQHAEGISCM